MIYSLPDVIDRSWLVSTYLSLKKAQALGYDEDLFSKLPKGKRDTILHKVKSLGSSRTRNKEWEDGYYFNNAMFRVVALTEIALKELFEQKTKMKPPPTYPWLCEWYEAIYKRKLSNINNARKRVNKFKHERRSRIIAKKFKTMQEGIDAFEELLLQLEQI